MAKFELIDVAYSAKDAQNTARQLKSQGIEVSIKQRTNTTGIPVWNVYGKAKKK